MSRRKFSRPAKLGTIPTQLVFDGRYKIEVGRIVPVKHPGPGYPWFKVRVDSIGPGAHVFVSYWP